MSKKPQGCDPCSYPDCGCWKSPPPICPKERHETASKSDDHRPPWHMAEQGYIRDDFEMYTEPSGASYVMIIRIGSRRRRVGFDTAGRVIYVRRMDDPPPQMTG